MRIIITGGTGYIGSYLLHNWKTNITAVDNFHTQRYCSLFNLPQNINFVESSFQDLFIDFLRQFDTVIHLAAIVDASKSFENKELVRQVNVDDTKTFIRKCEEAGVKKFIFPSSTSCYGKSKDDKLIEEFDEGVINPQSPYAEGKFEIEEFLRDSQRDVVVRARRMDYMILRFGTICGWSSGWRNQTAINKFCFNAVIKKPLPVWKDALYFYRPYLHLKDCKKSIEKSTWNEYRNQTLNILTGNYILKDILSMIARYKHFKTDWINTPLLNQYNYKISNIKSIKLFNEWTPNFEVDKREETMQQVSQGIEETLKALGNINL